MIDLVDTTLDHAAASPWTSKEYPPLAAWVADNQAPLDLLVEASKRSHFYSPSPAPLAGEPLSTAAPLQAIQTYREVARSLPVRAMWHAGEGRPKEAWQDLLALHRLAAQCVGNTMAEYLVAIAISEIACDYTCTLLGNVKLSSADARKILHDLSALPRLPPLASCVDHGERLSALDAVLLMASEAGGGILTTSDDPGQSTPNSLLNHVVIDWNIVLTEINFWFDRITAALKTSDPVARATAMDQVFADMEQVRTEMWSSSKLVVSVISRRQRSRLAATIFVGLCTSALQSVAAAENRTNSTLDLTRLAAALAVYRAEHASYPEKLTELVPGVLDKLPTDYYQAKPYIYRRTADGYLLYSCGENGVDDGGSNKLSDVFEGRNVNDLQKLKPPQSPDIPDGADDISIRVPQLPPKLPK